MGIKDISDQDTTFILPFIVSFFVSGSLVSTTKSLSALAKILPTCSPAFPGSPNGVQIKNSSGPSPTVYESATSLHSLS